MSHDCSTVYYQTSYLLIRDSGPPTPDSGPATRGPQHLSHDSTTVDYQTSYPLIYYLLSIIFFYTL